MIVLDSGLQICVFVMIIRFKQFEVCIYLIDNGCLILDKFLSDL